MKPKLIIGNKNYSSWSLRAWLLLKEAGIEFDEHRIVLERIPRGAGSFRSRRERQVTVLEKQSR